MSDIKLTFSGIEAGCDISITDGDIDLDTSLQTPILVSLLTDRLANIDDELPDSVLDDRRGWWGDSYGEKTDKIGSRLWLLGAQKQLQPPLNRAKSMADEGIAWLIADGYAKSIETTAAIPTDSNTGLKRYGVLGLDVLATDSHTDLRITAETMVVL